MSVARRLLDAVLAGTLIAVAIVLVGQTGMMTCRAQSADIASGTRMAVSNFASDGLLNLRSDPDPDAHIITRLSVGDQVVTTGKVVRHGSNRWYQVRSGNSVGWVNGRYLERAVENGRAPEVAGFRSDRLEEAGTHWTLNESKLVLSLEGDGWTFRYLEPRPGMIEEGVRRGTVLFKGREDGTGLSGTAYRFSKRCGALPYEVRGDFEPDGMLILSGNGARGLSRNCEVTQTEQYTLEFLPVE